MVLKTRIALPLLLALTLALPGRAAGGPAAIRRRETLTLLTPDGTLIHRDRMVLPSGSAGAALGLVLPAGVTFGGARVDNGPAQPVERGPGALSQPIGPSSRGEVEVEVVSFQEKARPGGASRLKFELPRVDLPVREHRVRLLLPAGSVYKVRSGALRLAEGRDPWVGSARFLKAPPAPGDPWSLLRPAPRAGAAALRGRVIIKPDSPVPGATVTVRSGATLPLVTVTDSRGLFQFPSLVSGDYEGQAEIEGFHTLPFSLKSLNAGTTRTVEIPLEMNLNDVITVTDSDIPSQEVDPFHAVWESVGKARIPDGHLPEILPTQGKVLILYGADLPEKVGVELEIRTGKEGRGWH
jgi:hypothetical protein